MKDLNKDGYGAEKEAQDFNLVNRDQEIIIGANNDDPEDENEDKIMPGEDFSLVEKTEGVEMGAKGMSLLGGK
jgi:hypothetical protein